MRRSTFLILVTLGAAVVGFTLASSAGRLRDKEPAAGTSSAARPQFAPLHWREKTDGPKGKRLEFSVDRFYVLARGWQARVGLKNDSAVAFQVGGVQSPLNRSFGLMLFLSGDQEDLEDRVGTGRLPTLRAAMKYEPSLPPILEPHSSWKGTISAPGSLVAGSWVRVVFGTLVAVGRTPDELPARLVWITDHAYRLRP
jgi:hypothetical protein